MNKRGGFIAESVDFVMKKREIRLKTVGRDKGVRVGL